MFPLLYHAHHNRYNEDIPFWLRLASRAGGPVLELGCGTGRVLIPIAEAGYHAVGLDNDPDMLRFLRTQLDPHLQPAPGLIEADISDFYFASRFPLIILPCNTLSTLGNAKRKQCLGCVSRSLLESGTFAASIPNPELLLSLAVRSQPELEDELIHPETGNPVQVSSSWQRTKTTFTVTWAYDHLLPDGRVDRLEAHAHHQIIPRATLQADLEHSGLVVTELYGDFDRSEYTHDSPHLIILASRARINEPR